MAYRGRYRQGEYVPLFCQCHDANNTPTLPTDCPQAVVWSPAGVKVASFQIPQLDRYVPVTGLFAHFLRLGSAFATLGNWRVVYEYLAGTYNGLDEDTFELIAGGNEGGNVISSYYFDRPQGKFIVQQLDSGRIVRGRNPKL